MATSTDSAVAELLAEAYTLTKAVVKKLYSDPNPFYPLDKVYTMVDGRQLVSLSTPLASFNPVPMQKCRKRILSGWSLNTHLYYTGERAGLDLAQQPFFLSSSNLIMIKWFKKGYATPVTSENTETLSFFFSQGDVMALTNELIDIIAP